MTRVGKTVDIFSDQWSPLNPEGKKHYDRNFLLQVRYSSESMQKPEGLQIPDILLETVSALADGLSVNDIFRC